MTRYGPDYSDDPRRETGDTPQEGVVLPDEYQRRTDRAGRDAARVAMGGQPIRSPEDALILETPRASEIALAIRNSTDNHHLKAAARRLIQVALDNDKITVVDAQSLVAYLDAIKTANPKDIYSDVDPKKRQAGEY